MQLGIGQPAYHRGELIRAFLHGDDAVACGLGYAHMGYGLSVFVEVEVEIVSKNDMVERRLVAVELFAVLPPAVEVAVVNVFRLDESHGLTVAFAYYYEVGRAAFYARRLVDGLQSGQHGVEKFLKRGAVTVFARQSRSVKAAYFFYVFVQVRHVAKIRI